MVASRFSSLLWQPIFNVRSTRSGSMKHFLWTRSEILKYKKEKRIRPRLQNVMLWHRLLVACSCVWGLTVCSFHPGIMVIIRLSVYSIVHNGKMDRWSAVKASSERNHILKESRRHYWVWGDKVIETVWQTWIEINPDIKFITPWRFFQPWNVRTFRKFHWVIIVLQSQTLVIIIIYHNYSERTVCVCVSHRYCIS